MFPMELPDGKGGPEGVFHNFALSEWVKHVMELQFMSFQSKIPFIFYSSAKLRQHKITGLSACKPIAKSIARALEELSKLSKKSKLHVPESTLRSLVNQISFHTNTLRGSAGDMQAFRKDLLSMIYAHGSPTFLLLFRLQKAFGQKVSLQEAKKLTAKDSG